MQGVWPFWLVVGIAAGFKGYSRRLHLPHFTRTAARCALLDEHADAVPLWRARDEALEAVALLGVDDDAAAAGEWSFARRISIATGDCVPLSDDGANAPLSRICCVYTRIHLGLVSSLR